MWEGFSAPFQVWVALMLARPGWASRLPQSHSLRRHGPAIAFHGNLIILCHRWARPQLLHLPASNHAQSLSYHASYLHLPPLPSFGHSSACCWFSGPVGVVWTRRRIQMRGVAVGWISLLALVARTLGVGHCRFCLLLHFAIAVLALDRSRGFQVTEGEGGGVAVALPRWGTPSPPLACSLGVCRDKECGAQRLAAFCISRAEWDPAGAAPVKPE